MQIIYLYLFLIKKSSATLDTVLGNTNLNTFTDSNLSALTTAYEHYYTVTNSSATLNEKMNFVIDYLRTNGYLK